MLEKIKALESKLSEKDQQLDTVKRKKDQEINLLKQEHAREITLLNQQKDMEIVTIKQECNQETSTLKIAKDKEISILRAEKDKEIDALRRLTHNSAEKHVVGNTQPAPVKVKKNSLFLELVHMTCDFNKVKKEKDTAKYNADKVKREQLDMTKTIEDLHKVLAEQRKEKLDIKHHAERLEMEQLGMGKTIEELKKMLTEQRGEMETCTQENEILHQLKEELLKDRSAYQQKFIVMKRLLIDARRK